jgi:ribosome maturation factor RimP
MELIERIGQLLEEKYASDEMFADCFTVDIELKPGQQTECICRQRFRPEPLKNAKNSVVMWSITWIRTGWLGETYGIEVSSPGVDRPLKFPRQYRKNIGRTSWR